MSHRLGCPCNTSNYAVCTCASIEMSENTDALNNLAHATEMAAERSAQAYADFMVAMEDGDTLKRDLARMTEQRDRLRFLLWHRHYHHANPLTVEEMDHIALGAPLESKA